MMKWFVALALILIAPTVHAQQIYETARAVRSLGMGGMYIPIVNDTDALFYNPAALAKVKGFNFTVPSVAAGINSDSISSLDTLKNFDSSNPSSYNSLYGKRFDVEAAGKAAFAMPYFGFGYYTNYNASVELHDPANPQFDSFFQNDQGYVIGGAVPLGPNIYGGLNVKRISRWGGTEQQLGLAEVSSGMSLDKLESYYQNKGTGYGLDLALMTEIQAPLTPTIAVVWQDVGDTSFTKTAGTDAPPHIEQNISAGLGVGFDIPGIDWTAGAEFRQLNQNDIQFGKKLHIGTELSIPLFDFRAGIDQGYFTYGAGFNFLIFRVDAASYTEELGVYPGQTAENRYAVSVSIDLSFDADFHFTDNEGKRRKLKQRR